MKMELNKYNLQDIALDFSYGTMPKDEDICETGYPIFSGYRFVGFSSKYNIEKRSLAVVARGVGGTGNVEIAEEKTFLTNLSIAVTINEELADLDFLKYYLNLQGLRYLDSGAAQSQITISNLKHHKILIPDINIQKRIVHRIQCYDQLIEVNNKRIKVLEQMAENLYKEWFVRFRFPGHETAEFENGLPKGWSISKLGDITQIKAGGDRPDICSEMPTNGATVPIFSNGIDNEGLYGYTKKPEIEKESITISARGTVGYVFFRRVPYVPIVRLIAIIPSINTLPALYLFYYLRKDSIIANGTSQQQITVPMVSKKRIIVPPLELLSEFERFEKPIWDEMDNIKKLNNELVKQRDLLLPRLMSGKLEV